MRSEYAQQLAHSLRTPTQLVEAGVLLADQADGARQAAQRYRLQIPAYYLGLIDQQAPQNCPIALQALPQADEADPCLPAWATALSKRAFGTPVPWRADAIGDQAHLVVPRLSHRYTHRAILHLTSVCAMYCRFCFRKAHLNDAERPLYRGTFDAAFDYLQAHTEVRELILTGGDPLSVADARLQEIFAAAAAVSHLKVVRLHSRMPVTLPARISPELCALLADQPFRVVLVAHFNHPRELTPQADAALRRLQGAGVCVLNQSVLLRRVNDRANTLFDLFSGLYERGVLPYYLHHPDWTPGTFAFRVNVAAGQALMQQLAGQLSGPAMPRYMLDVPGGLGKVQLTDAVEQVEAAEDARFVGALYTLRLAHTRNGSGQGLYFDLAYR
jgi:lysine 2,3-aminomutase